MRLRRAAVMRVSGPEAVFSLQIVAKYNLKRRQHHNQQCIDLLYVSVLTKSSHDRGVCVWV